MIAHDSRDTFYRMPSGAVENGTTVILRLSFTDEILPEKCRCNVWRKGYEAEIDMRYSKEISAFECTLDAVSGHDPLLYYFVFIYADRKMLFYGNNQNITGGPGQVYESDPLSYQITVYKAGFKTPSWWKEGPVYHIFVDRFYKSESYVNPRPVPDAYLHKNWDDIPLYLPHGNHKGYFPDDFFGGNLNGIIEKLDYIKSMGIRTIYLSPVFEAHSNHKYDTADYSKIDGAFGNNEIFNQLCEAASKKNMSVILDGVFSHTGDNSIYFNKYGNYDSIGAYQSPKSPYFDWYSFEEYPEKYKCWWDVETMPTINKDNPGFRNFIYGDGGIAQKWLAEGSSGWRLDVADELPMDFLENLRNRVKNANPNALIIGEVWEDASNKVSFGTLRNYCYGRTLDSVMNYPLRTAILDFMCSKTSSGDACAVLRSQMENYPPEFLNAAMNLLGSHDRARLRTVLSGAPDPDTLTRGEQADYSNAKEASVESADMVKCATALLFTIPGVPYIYYGDETGMTGMADPFNRKTYPWGKENKELIDFYRFIGNFRNNNDVLINGETAYYPINDDVLGCLRTYKNRHILTLVNRSLLKRHSFEISLPIKKLLKDALSGKTITAAGTNAITLELDPISFTILTT